MSISYQSIQWIYAQASSDWEHEADFKFKAQVAEPELKEPPLYRVIILNDDYTPMDFVVEVLEQFFGLSNEQATRVMLQVHTQGHGVCGIYPKDIAETKAALVNEYAKQNDHPLLTKTEVD